MTVNSAIVVEPAGVPFIFNNVNLPDYIRSHSVFRKMKRFTKVFPSIGLPNLQEDCEYSMTEEVSNEANDLLASLYRHIVSACNTLFTTNTSDFTTKPLYSTYNALISMLTYSAKSIKVIDGKVAIVFDRQFILRNKNPNLIIKEGESFFKGYNKISESFLKEYGITFPVIETFQQFKNFSALNSPNKKCKIVFSSSGEDGVWDIATMSMRGIKSCQSWDKAQSYGLIGSISSKFVGVIYITDQTDYDGFGYRMLKRAIVRYCIHKSTKTPALLVDRIYPVQTPSVEKLFCNWLTDKVKIPVISQSNFGEWNLYRLINNDSHKLTEFNSTELTYMDTKLPFLDKKSESLNYEINSFSKKYSDITRKVEIATSAAIKKQHDQYLSDGITNKHLFSAELSKLITQCGINILYILFNNIKLSPEQDNLALKTISHTDLLISKIRTALIDKIYINQKFDNALSYNGSVYGFNKILMNASKDAIMSLRNLFTTEYKRQLLNEYKLMLN